LDTEPSIAAFFHSTLKDWVFPPADEWSPEDIALARTEQLAIERDNILFGQISTKWMKLQQAHLSLKCSRKSPERWAADMVYKLLQISHTLWMTRNGILHEKDQQGLLLADGQTLREAITARYERGKAALLPRTTT
jgi:hypothetical protein